MAERFGRTKRAHLQETTLEDAVMAYEEEEPSSNEDKKAEERGFTEMESQRREQSRRPMIEG
jgi:hypothetical protein